MTTQQIEVLREVEEFVSGRSLTGTSHLQLHKRLKAVFMELQEERRSSERRKGSPFYITYMGGRRVPNYDSSLERERRLPFTYKQGRRVTDRILQGTAELK